MGKLSHFVIRYSKLIIITVILLTLAMAIFASKIEIKAGIEDMFPDTNPVVRQFNETNELFGGLKFAVIMLEDDNILDHSTLQKISELTGKLEEIDGVEEVISLTNIKKIKSGFFGIEVSQLIDPDTAAGEQDLKTLLTNEEQYIGSIISKDFKATSLLINFNKEWHNTSEPVKAIKQLATQYQGPEQIYITGNPVVAYDAQNSMKSDILKLLPFIIVIIVIILWLSFRSISGVLLPLSTVLISNIWTVGVLALLRKPLSIISVALPVLLVSVGSAYSIHIAARLQEEQKAGKTGREAVRKTITNVGVALLIAGTTTMAGFISLVFSDLVIIREFALSTAFGIGIALIISLLFVPAVYTHLSVKIHSRPHRQDQNFRNHFFDQAFQLISRKSGWIIGLALFAVVISAFAIPKLYPETGYLSYFRPKSSTRIAANLVDERFGGSASLDIIIQGDIKNPDLLSRIAAFQDEAAKIVGLNNPVSIVTFLKTINKVLNENDPAMNVIPTTREQIAQYLLLLSMSDANPAKTYLTFDENSSRVQFLMENMPARQIKQVLAKINELIVKHFDQQYPVIITGMPMLTGEISKLVISSQIQSIIASILMTFLITGILLKSFKRGLFCCLTILLTVLVNFGVMGWFKIPLDIATTMIASIAVGIGVDYSIHIYSRYQEELTARKDPFSALQVTIRHVGRANLYNALAVIAGFCVILLSSFPPLVNFGGLTALTMLVAFISAIFLLPALIFLS